jgi:hypothetical protein
VLGAATDAVFSSINNDTEPPQYWQLSMVVCRPSCSSYLGQQQLDRQWFIMAHYEEDK